MNNPILFGSSLLLVGVFVASVSQVLLKKSALKKHPSLVREYLNPYVMVAYLLMLGTTFLSILAYRYIPLSMGPILEATSYIYVTFFAAVIFKEKITGKKVLALALIVAGIVIYACGT